MISVVKHEVFMTKYEILKVSKFASREEIQKAYDEQMKEYMIGITGKDTPENAKQRALIRDAYATLINEDKRKAYDQSLLVESNKKIVNNEITMDMSFKTIMINFLTILSGLIVQHFGTIALHKVVLPFTLGGYQYIVVTAIYFTIIFYIIRFVMKKIICYVDEGEYNQGPFLFCIFFWIQLLNGPFAYPDIFNFIAAIINSLLLYFIVYRSFVPTDHL